MLTPFEVHNNHQLPSEMEEPVLEWNAENGLAVPMDMQFEFYDNLAEQPQEALDALLETPRPCKLLNPDLQTWQLGPLGTREQRKETEMLASRRSGLLWWRFKEIW